MWQHLHQHVRSFLSLFKLKKIVITYQQINLNQKNKQNSNSITIYIVIMLLTNLQEVLSWPATVLPVVLIAPTSLTTTLVVDTRIEVLSVRLSKTILSKKLLLNEQNVYAGKRMVGHWVRQTDSSVRSHGTLVWSVIFWSTIFLYVLHLTKICIATRQKNPVCFVNKKQPLEGCFGVLVEEFLFCERVLAATSCFRRASHLSFCRAAGSTQVWSLCRPGRGSHCCRLLSWPAEHHLRGCFAR